MAEKTKKSVQKSSISRQIRLDTPLEYTRRNTFNIFSNRNRLQKTTIHHNNDLGGRITEAIAHFLGTPAFIMWLTVFCIVWIGWNTLMPVQYRFDSATFGFTALTLMLSLQASYAAPLILLAQDRQADRERVKIEQDRARSERNLADTEYLAREIATIKEQLSQTASRDFIRQELKNLLEELEKSDDSQSNVKTNS